MSSGGKWNSEKTQVGRERMSKSRKPAGLKPDPVSPSQVKQKINKQGRRGKKQQLRSD